MKWAAKASAACSANGPARPSRRKPRLSRRWAWCGSKPRLREIEHCFGVQLADRRAVGAAHVVVVDFQFRLRVDLRAGVEGEVAVGEVRVSARRARMDVDAAVEGAAAPACRQVVLLDAADGAWAGVFDHELLIQPPATLHQRRPNAGKPGALAGENHVEVVAPEVGHGGLMVERQGGVALQMRLQQRPSIGGWRQFRRGPVRLGVRAQRQHEDLPAEASLAPRRHRLLLDVDSASRSHLHQQRGADPSDGGAKAKGTVRRLPDLDQPTGPGPGGGDACQWVAVQINPDPWRCIQCIEAMQGRFRGKGFDGRLRIRVRVHQRVGDPVQRRVLPCLPRQLAVQGLPTAR